MVTYNSLLADVPRTLISQNAELIADMPNVIARAEEYVTLLLDHAAFRAPPAESVVAPGDTVTPPGGTLEVRQVAYALPAGGWQPVRPRQEEAMLARYAGRQGSAYPTYYAELSDGSLQFFPAPLLSLTVRVTANVRPGRLSVATQENLLTTDFPQLLRCAALREGAIFMESDSQIALYTNEAMTWAEQHNREIARKRRDETAQRPIETVNVKGA